MAEFLPLSVAAAIAYVSLVNGEQIARERAVLAEHLDEVLPPEQVASGRFSDGAQRLDFSDGSDLSVAIELLRLRPPLLA